MLLGFALFAAGLLAALQPVSRHGVANAAGGDVTLLLWPAGQGRIDLAQEGRALQKCDFAEILVSTTACELLVSPGVPVTLTAVPEPNATIPDQVKADVPDYPDPTTSFVRWSRDDCASGTPSTQCTFTPETGGDWVTAVFTRLELEIGIKGQGTVTAQLASGAAVPLQCGDPLDFQGADSACHALVAADADVVLTATPTVAGTPIRWGTDPGCRPDGGNPASVRCTVTMSNIRTFATVAFGNPPTAACPVEEEGRVCPPQFPFQITPQLTVRVVGTGHGRVTGPGVDCRSTCTLGFAYQTDVTLNAGPADPGSKFIRWRGACATNPRCTFAAGSVSGVSAVFDLEQATTTQTTTTGTTTTTPTTTTPTTTTPTTTGKTPARLSARLTRVSMQRLRGRRVVVVALTVNRSVRGNLRLLKRGKSVASKSYLLAKGRNTLRLGVPAKAAPGSYLVRLRITSGSSSITLSSSVRVRR